MRQNQKFPQNLLWDVFRGTPPTQFPDDILATVYYIGYTQNPKYADVAFSYYRDKRTHEQLARLHEVTRERIRQMIVEFLRRLRNPYSLHVLQVGMNAYLMERVDAVSQGQPLRSKDDEIADEVVNHSAIGYLPLSTRAYNALKRAGIKKVQDIVDLGPTGLLHVNNIGEKTYWEIIDLLIRDYGESKDAWYIHWKEKAKGEAQNGSGSA